MKKTLLAMLSLSLLSYSTAASSSPLEEVPCNNECAENPVSFSSGTLPPGATASLFWSNQSPGKATEECAACPAQECTGTLEVFLDAMGYTPTYGVGIDGEPDLFYFLPTFLDRTVVIKTSCNGASQHFKIKLEGFSVTAFLECHCNF